MNVRIDKSFEKDTDRIKDQALLTKIAHAINEIIKCQRPDEIKLLKKLKGSHQHYRIRIGDYRIGITIIEDSVTFIRFMHRKDIYKYFP